MVTSAQQVAELSAQLEALTCAQEDLKARNRVLDNIVGHTNRQTADISLLQVDARPPYMHPHAAATSRCTHIMV